MKLILDTFDSNQQNTSYKKYGGAIDTQCIKLEN